MNYDEITKITAERISDYMTEAVNTDSIAVAEMFHNAAWGVRTLWFELVTKIDIDIHKKNRYASYDLRRKIEMQHEEFQKMTEREQVPLLKCIREGANKQVISSQADSLIKISRIWADFFPANTSNQPI